MPFENLHIIAEKINDSIPSTNALLEKGDIDAIVALAKMQADAGAAYIDVNIGSRDPALMADLVETIQDAVSLPLSIDTPSYEIAKAGLAAYDPEKAGGAKALLNSINIGRTQMFDILKTAPFRAILMANERMVSGEAVAAKTADEVLLGAEELYSIAQKAGMENDDIFFDPSLAPLGSDFEGYTKMTLDAIEKIRTSAALTDTHISVGLSNFTVQLPSKRADGGPVKLPLKNAFLTLACKRGLDYCIANPKEDFHPLADDDPAMRLLTDVLSLDGYDILMRVQEYYS